MPPSVGQIKAVENTDKTFHFILPAKPAGMSDELVVDTDEPGFCFFCFFCFFCRFCAFCEAD
jgi:hypothetical protein